MKTFSLSVLSSVIGFFKSRTIDAEHMIGVLYALLYLLPFLVNKLVFAIISWIFSYLPMAVVTIPLIMFVINILLFILFSKVIIRLFREKRFLLGIILLYLVLAFLLSTIFWFGSIFMSLSITTVLLIPDSSRAGDFLRLIAQYDRNYQSMSEAFESCAKLGAPITQTLGMSYLLNQFVPEKYKTIDLKVFDKIKRLLIKIGTIAVPVVAFLIFYHINRTSFTIIGSITVVIIWMIDPKNIVILINSKIKISDDDLKPEIFNKFKLWKLLISSVVAAWGISVYFFEKQSIEIRLYISLGLLLCFMILLVVWQLFLKKNGENWLNKNLKGEVAQKIIEENMNSDEGNF